MKTFLVIGGTGKVGSRLAEVLTAAGAEVRIASRTGGDVRFDWRDRRTWGRALDNVAGIFVVGPGSATDWSPLLADLLELASSKGVARAVLLSARGVEFLPDGAVGRTERALAAGPLAWTILRPSHFAQNFTEAMFVPVNGRVVAPVADGAEPFIDVQDIAEVGAAALLTGEWDGQTVELSGPESLTFDQATAILTERTSSSIEFVDQPLEVHADALLAAGTPDGYVTWRMAMLAGIRSGDDAYLSDGVQQVLGRPATSFTDWAAREVHAA